MSRGVATQPRESPAATWQRVPDTVAGMRVALDAPQLYFATIFADVSSTEQQR